jgi:hypothetical protein
MHEGHGFEKLHKDVSLSPINSLRLERWVVSAGVCESHALGAILLALAVLILIFLCHKRVRGVDAAIKQISIAIVSSLTVVVH